MNTPQIIVLDSGCVLNLAMLQCATRNETPKGSGNFSWCFRFAPGVNITQQLTENDRKRFEAMGLVLVLPEHVKRTGPTFTPNNEVAAPAPARAKVDPEPEGPPAGDEPKVNNTETTVGRLQAKCRELGIKYHHMHTAETLNRLIREHLAGSAA